MTPPSAQTQPKQATPLKTPPLPSAKPESLGLSPVRLRAMRDAFQREIDKGTTPGVVSMIARRGSIGWFEAQGRQGPLDQRSAGQLHPGLVTPHPTAAPSGQQDAGDRLGRPQERLGQRRGSGGRIDWGSRCWRHGGRARVDDRVVEAIKGPSG